MIAPGGVDQDIHRAEFGFDGLIGLLQRFQIEHIAIDAHAASFDTLGKALDHFLRQLAVTVEDDDVCIAAGQGAGDFPSKHPFPAGDQNGAVGKIVKGSKLFQVHGFIVVINIVVTTSVVKFRQRATEVATTLCYQLNGPAPDSTSAGTS